MNSERIKEIQQTMTAYPESISVMLALKQVWNECEQEDKWINIKDRLPDESIQVLGIMKDTLDQYICFYKKSRNVFIVYGAGVDPISDMKVTHWQPLPNPPKI